jgi:hypothetical protein
MSRMPQTPDNSRLINAADLALANDVDLKRFRAALRNARLDWHGRNGAWQATEGSRQHQDMQRVLTLLLGHAPVPVSTAVAKRSAKRAGRPADNDEAYIIDLCDIVLSRTALRQHRFDFLVGDPNAAGRCARLPVDAFYPDLKLVIEFYERQHSEPVGFFDRRSTVSGVARGQQRKLYDQRRRDVLPQHGYELIVFDYTDFAHDSGKRLLRDDADIKVIAKRLAEFLEQRS